LPENGVASTNHLTPYNLYHLVHVFEIAPEDASKLSKTAADDLVKALQKGESGDNPIELTTAADDAVAALFKKRPRTDYEVRLHTIPHVSFPSSP
jgi:hypothetical protein